MRPEEWRSAHASAITALLNSIPASARGVDKALEDNDLDAAHGLAIEAQVAGEQLVRLVSEVRDAQADAEVTR